ncbi:MAG: 1,4-alpha-glucan-branching enzyme, partial [Prevotella sp.]|nr:1,4-alpha-glucan-branching enzyme [Prevotella sp.]
MVQKKETEKVAKKATKTNSKSIKKAVLPVEEAAQPKHIGLVQNDGWLEPYEDAIRGRHDHALWKIGQLTRNGKKTLSDFATGHLYFGLHKLGRGWVFREWAPNATDIYLIGDFNDWKEDEHYRCKRIEGTGNWELKLKEKDLKHGQLYKMKVKWNGGEGERIPAWCRRVVQADQTTIFSAQVWTPAVPYIWTTAGFKPKTTLLL